MRGGGGTAKAGRGLGGEKQSGCQCKNGSSVPRGTGITALDSSSEVRERGGASCN